MSPSRQPDAAFTLVLHDHPDLDAVAAAYLALGYLSTATFPAGAEVLACYVDEVDEGARGATQDNPFSLYMAFQQLANRLANRPTRTRKKSGKNSFALECDWFITPSNSRGELGFPWPKWMPSPARTCLN